MNSNRQLENQIKAIDNRIKRVVGSTLMIGNAITVTSNTLCRIRLQGSSRIVQAALMVGASVEPGDMVVCIRLPSTNKWTVLGAYRDGSTVTNVALQPDAALSPPGSVAIEESYGALILKWNSPPQRQLTFQVEVADVGDEDNADRYTTSGAIFYHVCEPGTEKTMRVRGVTESWGKSAWSDWQTGTATGHLRFGEATELPTTPLGEFFDTDNEILYIGDGETWHAVAGGGVGGTGDSDWDADAEPESPSSIDDEFEDTAPFGAQWALFDYGFNLSASGVADVCRLTAASSAVDSVGGLWVDIPTGDETGSFTFVVKATLVTEAAWTPTAGASAKRIHFGAVLAEGVEDGNYIVFGPKIAVNASGSGGALSRSGSASWYEDWDDKNAFSEVATSALEQNSYEWYIRIRRDHTDTIHQCRCDISYDGITWLNTSYFRAQALWGTPEKIGLFINNLNYGSSVTVDFEFFRYRDEFDGPQDPCYGVQTATTQVIVEHGDLIGLDDDDHTQYHNDTRGDARYSQLGHTHDANVVEFTPAVLADWDGSADPGEVNDALDQLAERITDTDGHTHTESEITDLDHDAVKLQGRDILSDAPADDDVIAWDSGASQWQPKAAAVTIPIALQSYMDRNQKHTVQELHGGLVKLASAQPLSTGVDVTVTSGGGKLILVPTAGSDFDGTVTATGTSFDRDTQSETASDTDDLVVDALATDGATTDAEGNNIHSITGGYITYKWFKGSVTFSTTDTNLTVDVYHVSFEQVNDQPDLTIQSFDLDAVATNTAAWAYLYLYSVEVTGSKVTIAEISTLAIPVGESVADTRHRRREGGLAVSIDGSHDGLFAEVFLGPTASTYWEDINIKIWVDVEKSLTFT